MPKLTDQFIRGLKAQDERYEIADDIATGLRVRVGTSGKRVFIFRYSYKGKVATETLGLYPQLSLIKARMAVEAARERMANGLHPFKDEDDGPPAKTFTEVAEEYLAQPHIKTLRTAEERAMQVRNHIIPVLGDTPITEVGRDEVRALVSAVIERNAPKQANTLQWLCKTILTYAESEGYIPANPVATMRRPVKEEARDRVLSLDELRALWAYITHPKEWRSPTCRCLAFMLATAQRRQECAFICRSEVDEDRQVWVIPKERSKNGRAHAVPLTDWHMEILGKPNPASGLYFHSVRGENGAMSLSAITNYAARYRQMTGMPHWQPHDLRRTATTWMGDAGVPREYRKRLLNHSDGDVTGIYDLYEYLKEKRQAMEAWRDFLKREVVRD